MIATLLFAAFLGLMFWACRLAPRWPGGCRCHCAGQCRQQWFGLLAVPQNFYAGLGKYPLLAIPMFVLVG